MNPGGTTSKESLRQSMREALAAIPDETRRDQSNAVCTILRKQAVWRKARSVLFYAALGRELDLSGLWEVATAEGKRTALPRFDAKARAYGAACFSVAGNDLHPGQYGIAEPRGSCPEMPLNQLDLIFVPGLAFDLSGCRLGRGKGYYDRMLRSAAGVTCGVAWDLQIVTEIPVESHDIRLHYVLTPTGWHDCRLNQKNS